MNNEKVKEIKDKLEKEYFKLDKEYSDHLAYGGKADKREEEIYFLRDVIEFINELENENNRLSKKIVKILLSIDTVKEMNDMCNIDEQIKQAVKEFAEKVKNKLFEFFQDNEELDGKISVGPLYVDVIGVEAKDGTIISLGLIDELLKECLND